MLGTKSTQRLKAAGPLSAAFESNRPEGADRLVITPGGFRSARHVHRLREDHILDGSLRRLVERDREGNIIEDFGPFPVKRGAKGLMPRNVYVPRDYAPAISGWLAYVVWPKTACNYIAGISSVWVVPPPPTNQGNQVLFLFPGIQSRSMILQPVLQWGDNGSGIGNNWGVASWYADGQGGPAHALTSFTVVKPDMPLTAVIEQTPSSRGGFNFACGFREVQASQVGFDRLNSLPELTEAVITLESYQASSQAQFPQGLTQVTQIDVVGDNGPAAIFWQPAPPARTGQQAVVVANQTPNGEIDLYF